MDWKKITKAVVTVSILGLAVYDVIALALGGVEATISRYALEFPQGVAFGMGYVMGHLFWPQTKKVKDDA